MMIEAKNGPDPFAPHQRERQTIGQTQPLVRKLLQPLFDSL